MADLRARLADAVSSHFLLSDSPLRCNCGWRVPTQSSTIGRDFELHRADVLLSLPGIAIVELPEPDREVPPHLFNSMTWGSETNIELAAWPQDGVITNVEGEEISPRDCREIAAALLAVAHAAESVTE